MEYVIRSEDTHYPKEYQYISSFADPVSDCTHTWTNYEHQALRFDTVQAAKRVRQKVQHYEISVQNTNLIEVVGIEYNPKSGYDEIREV